MGTVCEILLAASVGAVTNPEPVNLAFGVRTDLMTLIEKLEKFSGKSAIIEHQDPRPGDVPHSEADNASLRGLFPDIQPVGLDEGLQSTIDWFNTKY